MGIPYKFRKPFNLRIGIDQPITSELVDIVCKIVMFITFVESCYDNFVSALSVRANEILNPRVEGVV